MGISFNIDSSMLSDAKAAALREFLVATGDQFQHADASGRIANDNFTTTYFSNTDPACMSENFQSLSNQSDKVPPHSKSLVIDSSPESSTERSKSAISKSARKPQESLSINSKTVPSIRHANVEAHSKIDTRKPRTVALTNDGDLDIKDGDWVILTREDAMIQVNEVGTNVDKP